MKCPCCGGETPDVPIDELLGLDLSDMEERMMTLLHSIYPRGMQMDAMLMRLYEGRNEPENADLSVRVTMTRLRKKLEKAGWTVPHGHTGRGYNTKYRLERLQ